MTRDDRIVMVAIATTFALSALVMAAIVVKGSAIHDRFFFGADPVAAADRLVPARAAAIPARSGSIPRVSEVAVSTPFAHCNFSAQRPLHLAVAKLVGDARALPFEADHRDRDEDRSDSGRYRSRTQASPRCASEAAG